MSASAWWDNFLSSRLIYLLLASNGMPTSSFICSKIVIVILHIVVVVYAVEQDKKAQSALTVALI